MNNPPDLFVICWMVVAIAIGVPALGMFVKWLHDRERKPKFLTIKQLQEKKAKEEEEINKQYAQSIFEEYNKARCELERHPRHPYNIQCHENYIRFQEEGFDIRKANIGWQVYVPSSPTASWGNKNKAIEL